MKNDGSVKGTGFHRFAIRGLTVFLALLIFWVLGFLVSDIRSIPGPDYQSVESRHVDPALVTRVADLDRQIVELDRQIGNQTEKQKIVGDSSRSLQQTINQLIELWRLGIEKSLAFSSKEQENFTASLNLFLENQRRYQELSQTVADMVGQKQELAWERERVQRQIEEQRRPARIEYDSLQRKHQLRLAFLQLAILLPLLAVAAVLVVKKRSSIYAPLLYAFGAATLLKVVLVVHEYFPTRYFKYIFIGGLLVVVARLLVYVIRSVAFPKAQWLAKQHREGYERFLCPVCEYPIRTGPRRFLFWNRRTVNRVAVAADGSVGEEPYTCPACGTVLFDECPSCHKVRHALLPHCQHCGAAKE